MGQILVWVLILLFVVDSLSGLVHPLDKVPYFEMTQAQWAQRSLAYKVSSFESEKGSADALVLGSSLPMSMIYYADSRHFNSDSYSWTLFCCQKNLSPVMAYPYAKYLESRFSKAAGKDVHFANLTSPGCMASDALVTLSRALSGNKRPRLVVLAIAPRDFIDNLAQPIGRTLQYSSLINLSAITLVMPHVTSLEALVDLFLDSVSNVYRERNNFRTAAAASTHKLLSRLRGRIDGPGKSGQAKDSSREEGITESAAVKPLPAEFLARFPSMTAAMKEDLAVYNARYNPPNFARLTKELSCFESILRRCRQEKLPVVVFNMPISDANKALIAANLYERYQRDTESLSASYGADFVNLDEMKLEKGDFSDSVHLRESGAPKVTDAIVASLKGQL